MQTSMMSIFANKDIINMIFDVYLNTGADYKTFRLIDKTTTTIISSTYRLRYYMNALSTLIMMYPMKQWISYNITPYITSDICDQFECCRMPNKNRNYVAHMNNLNKLKTQQHNIMACLMYFPITDIRIGDLDWYFVSSNITLTIPFITANFAKFTLTELAANRALTPELIRENWAKLPLESLVTNSSLTWELISLHLREILDADVLNELSQNPNLTVEFIRHYAPRLNWCMISRNARVVSLAFVREFESQIVWNELWRNINITDDIIETYYDKIEWYEISTNLSVSLEFLEKNIARFKGILYR